MGRRGSGIQTASDGGKSSSRQLRQGGRGLLQAEEQIIRREPVVAALQPEAATDTDLEVREGERQGGVGRKAGDGNDSCSCLQVFDKT
jgi:hypothetical protein